MKNLTLILESIISFMGYSQEIEQPQIIFEGLVVATTKLIIN